MMVRARLIVAVLCCLAAMGVVARPALAQQVGPPRPDRAVVAEDLEDAINPLKVLSTAGSVLPGVERLPASTDPNAVTPSDPSSSDGLSVGINIMLLLTVIALVPSVMLMTTCFVRIMIVLALLRQAMGAQSIPPAQVVTGLALFMTALVMQPTIERIWDEAVVPYRAGEITDYDVLWERGAQPMRDYMFDQIEATDNWSSLYMIMNYKGIDTSEPENLTRADVSTVTLIPAYMLSELKVSFLMGFRVYLPFLVIDMVIASLLISMSMMMLPPVLISLPFKLMLFVLVDGWTLVVGSLLESFVVEGASERLSAEPAAAMLLLIPLCLRQVRAPKDSARVLIPERARRPAHAVRRVGRSDRP